MSTILEARRRRYPYDQPELIPHTFGAEDPETTAQEIRAMIDAIFGVGHERREQLDGMEGRVLDHSREGHYYIRDAHVGDNADFNDQANHAYLKEKYPWLHIVYSGLGFDEDDAADSHGEFEVFLGSIPHEEWTSFVEDMESLENYPVLDEQASTELEMKEQDRWVTEDGAPDLIKEMVESAVDAYEAYLLSKVTLDMIWEWMRETDHYPEHQGEGSVWMDMDKYAKEPETQEWFLEQLDDDLAGWLEIKKKAYQKVLPLFDRVLQKMAGADEAVADVYNRLSEEELWRLFLKTFPDEQREDDECVWDWDQPTFELDYEDAVEALPQKEWFWKLVQNWTRRGPESHPEFKFENLEDEEVNRYVGEAGWRTFELTFDHGPGEYGYSQPVKVPLHLLAGLRDDDLTNKVVEYAWETLTDIDQAIIDHEDWDFLRDVVELDPNQIDPEDLPEGVNEAQEGEPDPDDPKPYIDALDPTQSLLLADIIEPEIGAGETEKWRLVYDVKPGQQEVGYDDQVVGWIAQPGWTLRNPNDWLASVSPEMEQHCANQAQALHWIGVNRPNDPNIRFGFNEAQGAEPGFGFNEAQEGDPDDPDDPETWFKYGGGLKQEVAYEDDKIVVLHPRDLYTLNYHLHSAGRSEINDQVWRDLFKYKDVFVIQAKLPPDLSGRQEKRELALIYGSSDTSLRLFSGGGKAMTVEEVMANPEYGRSIRRMLLRHYRKELENDPKAAHVLLQLGGGREVRRGERHGHLNRADLGVAFGLHYVAKHKYKLAAKAFNRSVSTITPKGVWLIFDSVEDLIGVFENEGAASTVFAHDHHDWFDHYYHHDNLPEPKDVAEFLDEDAIKHIRSVMINRRVYFPDTDQWLVLTPKILAEYDDATLLSWITHPSDEDAQEEVWDDIREAISLAGADILSSASQDEVYTGFVRAAVRAIDGQEHKWAWHPTKKYKSGERMEAFKVFVPWASIKEFAEKYQEEHGYPYDGDLEGLAVDSNADSINPEAEHYQASWRDVNKDWAKENLQRIHDLEPPEPIPGSPDYVDPAQGELPLGEASETPEDPNFDVDDPNFMSGLVSGIPLELEKRVQAVLRDSSQAHEYQVLDLKLYIKPYFPHSEEEIDASDGRLYNHPPHQTLWITYRTEPETSHEVQSAVFRKVREQVINVMRWLHLGDYSLANAEAMELPVETVVFYFVLYPRKEPTPPPQPGDEEVPF